MFFLWAKKYFWVRKRLKKIFRFWEGNIPRFSPKMAFFSNFLSKVPRKFPEFPTFFTVPNWSKIFPVWSQIPNPENLVPNQVKSSQIRESGNKNSQPGNPAWQQGGPGLPEKFCQIRPIFVQNSAKKGLIRPISAQIFDHSAPIGRAYPAKFWRFSADLLPKNFRYKIFRKKFIFARQRCSYKLDSLDFKQHWENFIYFVSNRPEKCTF